MEYSRSVTFIGQYCSSVSNAHLVIGEEGIGTAERVGDLCELRGARPLQLLRRKGHRLAHALQLHPVLLLCPQWRLTRSVKVAVAQWQSLSHLVTQSLSQLVTQVAQSLGHLVTWSLSRSVTWSLDHSVAHHSVAVAQSLSSSRSVKGAVSQSKAQLLNHSRSHSVTGTVTFAVAVAHPRRSAPLSYGSTVAISTIPLNTLQTLTVLSIGKSRRWERSVALYLPLVLFIGRSAHCLRP
eukprot:1190334-Prorocentrum_minimum.AAC.1